MSGLLLDPAEIDCPYCGERLDILIDCSIGEQSYIEDCQVCCRPITINITPSVDSHSDTETQPYRVSVFHENEC